MMEKLALLFTLKPIIFGLIGMLVSGFCFPAAGVIILRNNLITMRYMLMHGVILGGILAIALKLPLVLCVAGLNVILVLIMYFLNISNKTKLATVSTSMMVLTMGLASLFSHIFDVPSKDMLELLWGSPFALTASNLTILIALSVVLILYIIIFFKPITLLFFDSDIAQSAGVKTGLHKFIMLLITALVISVAMKMVGALLIDALVILPVTAISRNSKSLKGLFLGSCITGFVLSLVSYFLSLIFNLPVSGLMAVLSVLFFIVLNLIKKIKEKKLLRRH